MHGSVVSTVDNITVLTAVDGIATKRITKTITGEIEIAGYSAGTWFRVSVFPIGSIDGLASALSVFERYNCVVIRGAPQSEIDLNQDVRRLKGEMFETPACGRYWVMIDFDKIQLPSGLRLATGIEAVCEHLVQLLPEQFRGASYCWQLSSSAGLGDPSIESMHLWFWLGPVHDDALKQWGQAWNAAAGWKIIDTALFNDVQAHYVAAPVFEGMADPFPQRTVLVKKAVDAVPTTFLVPMPVDTNFAIPAPAVGKLVSCGGFEAILGQIGDHPGGQGFHEPIIRAAASYVSTHDGEVDVEALYERIRQRVESADASQHEPRYIAKMASREHIVPAIKGAIKKYGGSGDPMRKTSLIKDITPHFDGNSASVEKAVSQLKRAVDGFFG